VTPARLRQLAEREDAAALRALDLGDAAAARDYRILAQLHREVADAMEAQGLQRLTGSTLTPTVNQGTMVDDHREAISRAHTPSDSAPMKAARKAGFLSLADLAEKLGVSKSFMSQVMSGKKKMPPDRAAAFERLTGYPASRWP
jgi:hypothetical protein